jgi:hypothetical protein
MTRLEAIRSIRKGERLEEVFTPKEHGVSRQFVVMLYHIKNCDLPRASSREGHKSIGPIHCMFFSGGTPRWLHVTPKQLLGFIRRNYPRK